MKVLSIISATLMLLVSGAMAQGGEFDNLLSLPAGVTDLSAGDMSVNAGPEVFNKYKGDIDLGDIAGQVQNGGHLYTTGDTAILVVEGGEPVLLMSNSDGGIEAMFICRILPICNETQE